MASCAFTTRDFFKVTEMESNNTSTETVAEEGFDLSAVAIALLKGVIYRDDVPGQWSALLNLQGRTRDYMRVLGLDLVLDDSEGYAFLRSRSFDDGVSKQPRLIARRPLSFQVSLLLALLRKKLAEFDAGAGDTRLVLTRDTIVDMVRVFLPDSNNEAKLFDQVDANLNKIVELGFLRRLKSSTAGAASQPANFEVRRILKAFVDAQWLADFDGKLEEYRKHLVDQIGAGPVTDG
jgi:Domain of unknown function (DUF4194)